MPESPVNAETLIARLRDRAGGGRTLLALAGPPGAGKSTLAARLAAALGEGARVVPMDGFHYDNAVLDARGLRARKGAPETFDAAGFGHLLRRLRSEEEVAIPVFDRAMDLARAGAEVVGPADRILIVEGNYLLLDESPWRGFRGLFDMTVRIEVPEAELERRLIARWEGYGLDPQAARARALGNDIPNARRVVAGSAAADLVIAGA